MVAAAAVAEQRPVTPQLQSLLQDPVALWAQPAARIQPAVELALVEQVLPLFLPVSLPLQEQLLLVPPDFQDLLQEQPAAQVRVLVQDEFQEEYVAVTVLLYDS